MSLDLDPQEVLEHLHSLGYYNITGEQLKEFIKDLKKLIKYDLLKEERKYRLAYSNLNTADKENNICKCPSLPPTDRRIPPERISDCVTSDKSSSQVFHHDCECTSVKSPTKSVPPRLNKITKAPITTADAHFPTCSNCQHIYNKQQVVGERCREPTVEANGCHCCNELNQNKTKDSPSTSAKKQSDSLKQCPSFIRPGSAKSKPPKADPVALYHYYKALWAQHTLPGENSHEDLRWRIRHKMMTHPVLPKGQSETKVTKRPEWTTS